MVTELKKNGLSNDLYQLRADILKEIMKNVRSFSLAFSITEPEDTSQEKTSTVGMESIDELTGLRHRKC